MQVIFGMQRQPWSSWLPAGARTAGRIGTGPLAAELEQAIAASTGVRARAVVLSREELARCVHDNPYPGARRIPGCRMRCSSRSELRRRLARAGGPTSAVVAGTARNWATVRRLVQLCGL